MEGEECLGLCVWLCGLESLSGFCVGEECLVGFGEGVVGRCFEYVDWREVG